MSLFTVLHIFNIQLIIMYDTGSFFEDMKQRTKMM